MNASMLFTGVVGLSVAVSASALNLNEGRWEIELVTEMEGMPVALAPHIYDQCLTRESAIPKPPAEDDEMQCNVLDTVVENDTVLWEMDCEMDGSTLAAQGRVTYNGDTLDGQWKMTGTVTGITINMTQTVTGRRIGEC